MRRISAIFLVIAIVGLLVFIFLSRPNSLQELTLASDYSPDTGNGETMFWAGGCASCHASVAADDADKVGDDESAFVLGGGLELATPFGIFRSPNISPDVNAGIGSWSELDFVNAMQRGVSPQGEHYYPAFPYSYYQNIVTEDLVDLFAFIKTLPAVADKPADHSLKFPFNVRRGLGLWKRLYLDATATTDVAKEDPVLARGRYLVNGPGHCGACHTGRDQFGGQPRTPILNGGVSFESDANDENESTGGIPNITPHEDGIGEWTIKDIVYSFETGLKPDFDTFGDEMVSVQKNLSQLSASDRVAIATYLKDIEAVPND